MRVAWACLFGFGIAVLGGCASVADHLAAGRVGEACRQARGDVLFGTYREQEIERVRARVAERTEVRLDPLADAEVEALLGEPLTGARLARVRWESADAASLQLSLLPPDHPMDTRVARALLHEALPPLTKPEQPLAPLGPASEPPPPPPPPAPPKPRRAPGLVDAMVGLITLPVDLARGLAVGLVEVLIVLPMDIASQLLGGRPVRSPYRLFGQPRRAKAKPWFDDALLDEAAWRAEVDRREAIYLDALALYEAKVQARTTRVDAVVEQMTPVCDQGRCTRLVVLPPARETLSFSLDARFGEGNGACTIYDVPVQVRAPGVPPAPPSATVASAATTTAPPTAPVSHALPGSVFVDEDRALPPFADGAPPLPDAARVFRTLRRLSPAATDDVRVLCRVQLTPAYRRLAADFDVRLAWGSALVHGATLEGGRRARSFFVTSPPLRLGAGDHLKLTLGLRRGSGHTYLGAQQRRFEGAWPVSFATKSFVAKCRAALHADVLEADARAKRKGRLAALERAVQALEGAVETGEPGLVGQGFPEAADAAVQDAAHAAAAVASWSDPRVVTGLAARSAGRARWEERAAERRRVRLASTGPLQAPLPLAGGARVESVRSLCDDPRSAREAIDFAVDYDKRAFAERCLVLVVFRAGASELAAAPHALPAPVALYGEDGRQRAAKVDLVATEGERRWTDFSVRASPGQRLLALVRAADEDPQAPLVRVGGTWVRPAPFDPIGLDVGTVLAFLDGSASVAAAPADLGFARVRSAWRLCGLPAELKGRLGTFFTEADFRYTRCVSVLRITVGPSKMRFDRLDGLTGLDVVDEGGRKLREPVVVLRRMPPHNDRRETTWEEGTLDPGEEAVLVFPSAAPRYVRARSVEPGAHLFVPFVEHTLDAPTLDALR